MEDYNTTPPPVPPTPGSSNQGLPPHEPWQEPPVESPPVRDEGDDIPPLKPNNWLWASILATLFCCIFFGVVGIVYAARVDSYYYRGMYAEAEKFSKKAKMWTLLAVAAGVVYIAFWLWMLITGNLPEYMENFIENNASGYNF